GIWARTNGYLKARYVDIGDRVRKGQQLADIDTPEVDQQLMQAIATMNQDKANVVKFEADLALARTTRQRYVVAGPGTVSKQQIDERTSAVTDAEKVVDAGRATVNADEANVRRLLELQSFQKVYAPFDGIITVRNVDPGSLISAGSTSGTTELFTLAQVDILRIFVFVPQSYAPEFKVQRPNPSLIVPQSALLIDAKGVRVALVDADGTLHYRSVQIGRDFGNDVEVLSGVDTTDVLATGLAANIAEGSRVDIAKPAN